MAQGLKGKVAVVTGASRGIGRAIALRLAQDGAAVVVNYAGSTQQAQETVALIKRAGGKAVSVQADVSKVGDVKRLFDACFEKFGRLDILVNNAGVMSSSRLWRSARRSSTASSPSTSRARSSAARRRRSAWPRAAGSSTCPRPPRR